MDDDEDDDLSPYVEFVFIDGGDGTSSIAIHANFEITPAIWAEIAEISIDQGEASIVGVTVH